MFLTHGFVLLIPNYVHRDSIAKEVVLASSAGLTYCMELTRS
jgi:hypothetical protein